MLSGPLALLVSSRDNCCWRQLHEMVILGILGRVFSGLLVSFIVGIFVKFSLVNYSVKAYILLVHPIPTQVWDPFIKWRKGFAKL